MSDKPFFDTNILVYACDSSEAEKQATALQLIEQAGRVGNGVLSTQVLGEFFHATVVKRKLLSATEAEAAIRAYHRALVVLEVDFDLVCDAMANHGRFQLRYWDSLIVAAANRAGCTTIVSEDFNHGQNYDGAVVINPFQAQSTP